MITYEVALDKAKRADSNIDSYMEYPEAFIFTNSKATGHDREDNAIVIERKTGDFISYIDLVMDYNINLNQELKQI